MRPLINFSILLLLPLVISFSSGNRKATTGNDLTYCNARFDFCLQYPNAIFTHRVSSDNDDGITLSSEDGLLKSKVYGANTMEGATIVDLFQELVDELATANKKVEVLSNSVSKTAYEATFRGDEELHYYRTLLQPNHITVTLMITVPRGMEEMLHSLQKDMVLNPHS